MFFCECSLIQADRNESEYKSAQQNMKSAQQNMTVFDRIQRCCTISTIWAVNKKNFGQTTLMHVFAYAKIRVLYMRAKMFYFKLFDYICSCLYMCYYLRPS